MSKTWRWSGKFLIQTAKDHMEKLCNVALTDLAGPPDFHSLFDSLDAIQFTRMLDAADVHVILASCGSVRRLAKLDAENGRDHYPLISLLNFMEKKQQVCNLFSGICSADIPVNRLQ